MRWGFSSPCVIMSVPHKPQLNEQCGVFQGQETEPFTSCSCVHLAATAEFVNTSENLRMTISLVYLLQVRSGEMSPPSQDAVFRA